MDRVNMPKTRRDLSKRLLAQAYINIDYAGKYIHQLANTFEEQHPDLAQILELTNEGLFNVTELLKNFARISWMDDNPDWTIWAATGRPRHSLTITDDATTDANTVDDGGNNIDE